MKIRPPRKRRRPEWLRLGVAARRYRVHRDTLYYWVEKKRVEAQQLGGAGSWILVNVNSLRTYLRSSR